MGIRPKESLVGIVGALGSLYGANKLVQIQSGFSQYNRDITRNISRQTEVINRQTELQAYGFQSILELQAGTMYGISKVANSINILELELSKVTNILQRQEMREDKVGDLKLIILEIDEALDFVDSIKKEYTPWATFQTRLLLDLIGEKKIKIHDFKHLPPTEIKYVKNILNRAEDTYRECTSLLEDSGTAEDHESLISIMKRIISLEQENSKSKKSTRKQREKVQEQKANTSKQIFELTNYPPSEQQNIIRKNKLKSQKSRLKQLKDREQSLARKDAANQSTQEKIISAFKSISHLTPHNSKLS